MAHLINENRKRVYEVNRPLNNTFDKYVTIEDKKSNLF